MLQYLFLALSWWPRPSSPSGLSGTLSQQGTTSYSKGSESGYSGRTRIFFIELWSEFSRAVLSETTFKYVAIKPLIRYYVRQRNSETTIYLSRLDIFIQFRDRCTGPVFIDVLYFIYGCFQQWFPDFSFLIFDRITDISTSKNVEYPVQP